MNYASYTRNTGEPLKRIAHGRRFAQVVSLIASPTESDTVLDYGCGDGHLFSHFMHRLGRSRLVGYDPDPKLLTQASDEVAAGSILSADIEALKRRHPFAFSLVYCMEVCEHLTDKATGELFDNIKALASPRAQIVFGVPIETGLSGFLKSLYRLAHGGRQGASVAKAFKSLLGVKIARQMTDVEWFGSHTGFEHRRLRDQIEAAGFRVRRSHCLPFPVLGTLLNNEIYFVCSRAPSSKAVSV